VTSVTGTVTDAVRNVLRVKYGARTFAELVEPEGTDPFVLVLSQAAKDLATQSPAVRDSGLSVKTILEAPRMAAALSSPVPLWTAASANAALADELLPTEIIETAWQPQGEGPRPVVIDHDFSAFAPKQVGWLHGGPSVLPVDRDLAPQPFPEPVSGYAQALLGTRYRLATKTSGREMDCSGFIWLYFYRTRGFRLPRLARWQALATDPRNRDAAVEGSLVFFAEHGGPIHHVGLVSDAAGGEITIAHCSSRAGGVIVQSLSQVSEGAVITFGQLREPLVR
jgi:cell wall-associated NlpC family hydrolase